MANQPTKYRKFVVGAASAALVASAVAPVAFAADFSDTKGNTHEEAINALSEAGVIKGYEDGTFKPNKTLTRSDVVKLMGKWLVSEGYKVPADAQSKPRFADLKSTSNKELLEMAAVVYDNGVFVGTPDGKLDPTGDITRENMAIVLVRAFDRVHDIDLASYVADQDFKKDVTDLGKAKAEARPAIDVLDFFDITNPAAPEFNPKATTTRGHFATFLHKTINADFSDVEGGVVTGVASVKAVNSTTVEVAFKDEVKNIDSLKFTIDGLTVSNAAVKQTDKKVVVLTTAVQKGGEKYTVTLDNKAIGSFTGVSSVVPTKITVTNDAVQGVVGKQVILTADIGVKEAGVPVTFNVAAGSKLNSDHVEEVTTNADGIATYSYTQYVAGYSDDVAVYPTGAPATRAVAKVFWGVDNILTLDADDKKGTTLNNGESKVYKVTYKDPKTGKPLSDQKLNVTFAENVDVPVDKLTKATVNGQNPHQLTNGNVVQAQVTTNSKGEATFTVTGTNTKATPVVFVDQREANNQFNGKLDNAELRVTADQLTFAAQQVTHEITIERDGGEDAALNANNGRKYKVVVKNKDGKVAAGETVNVAFNEDIDRDINTNTKAVFTEQTTNPELAGTRVYTDSDKKISLKLNSKGEGEFVITSATPNDYATPIAWIDINSSNAVDGKLDEGEAYKLADKTYFVDSKITAGAVKVYDSADVEVKDDKTLKGNEAAKFVFTATNQSKKPVSATNGLKASYTVVNTGTNDVEVTANGQKTVVSADRTATVQVDTATAAENAITVKPVGDKNASVRVEANATTNDTAAIYLGNYTATAKFVSTNSVSDFYTGDIVSINKADQKIYFDNKSEAVSYKDATFTGVSGAAITKSGFETLLASDQYTATYTKDADGKVKIDLIRISTASTGTPGTATTTGSLLFTSTGTTINSIPVGAIQVTDADLNTNPLAADTATVTITDSATPANSVVVTLTETGNATGVFENTSIVDVSSLADGVITVKYNDAANASGVAAVVTDTATLDTTAPVAATEDGSADKEGTTQSADFNIVVNAETGAKVTATIGGTNALKTVTDVTAAAGKATLPIDIAKLASGSNAIVITVTDAAGNASTPFTVNVTK